MTDSHTRVRCLNKILEAGRLWTSTAIHKINSLPRNARGHSFEQIAISDNHLAIERGANGRVGGTRAEAPRSGKCSFVCYNPVKAIILRRGSLRSAPFRNSAEFRPIRGRFRRARDRLRFCARHDYPVVQFMPANDCNLRSIRLVEHFPPSSPHRPRLSTLPVARCSRPPIPSPGPCPAPLVRFTRMQKSAKHPEETSDS